MQKEHEDYRNADGGFIVIGVDNILVVDDLHVHNANVCNMFLFLEIRS